MLVSLLDNTPPVGVNLYYFHNDIHEDQIEKFKEFFEGKLNRIEFYKLDTKDLEGLYSDERVPLPTYFRIRCAEVLPSDIKRVLYLDPDVIVKQSLSELYDTDLKGNYLGAVEDFFPYEDKRQYLKIPAKHKYFNSGVMLIDLEKFRENRVSERTLDFARKAGSVVRAYDQDALNAVLYDKWLPLEQKWNVTNICYERERSEKAGDPETKKMLKNPAIIHYTCSQKPWDYPCEHPLKREYRRYLAMTPFRGTKPNGYTAWNVIRTGRARLYGKMPPGVENIIRSLESRIRGVLRQLNIGLRDRSQGQKS